MADADYELMMRILRDMQEGQAQMRRELAELRGEMNGGLLAIREEMSATRAVLVDVVVQLTARVNRLEKQPT